MSNSKQNEKIAIVYCVTCFGKLVGTYANSETAFREQMNLVNRGRVAELVPQPIIYDLNDD